VGALAAHVHVLVVVHARGLSTSVAASTQHGVRGAVADPTPAGIHTGKLGSYTDFGLIQEHAAIATILTAVCITVKLFRNHTLQGGTE